MNAIRSFKLSRVASVALWSAILVPTAVGIGLSACSSTSGGAGFGPTGDDAGAGVDGSHVVTDAAPQSTTVSDAGGAPGSDAGTNDGGSGALGCAVLPLCDDFEGIAAGGPPKASLWTVLSPQTATAGSVTIDNTQSHSGKNSVKVVAGSNYNDHAFITNSDAVTKIGKHIFGRYFMRIASAFGTSHSTIMSMADMTPGSHLRLSEQNSAFDWNREMGDFTLPSIDPVGMAASYSPAVNEWFCVEFEIDATQQPHAFINTWINSKLIAGLVSDNTPTPDIDQSWNGTTNNSTWEPSLVDFSLGWESYGNEGNTLWFDDVALGAARIGCGN